jgi:hypothetical protein
MDVSSQAHRFECTTGATLCLEEDGSRDQCASDYDSSCDDEGFKRKVNIRHFVLSQQ